MSKANEMFEKLGYEKLDGYEGLNLIYIKFRKRVWIAEYQEIIFDLEHNLLNIKRENEEFYRTTTAILNMQELQAINEKCKELGWLE